MFRLIHFFPATRHSPLATVLLLLTSLLPSSAFSQVATSTPPFGSYSGGPDVINLGNNNAHLTIPVLHKKGRGLDFNYDFSYDSSIWGFAAVNGGQAWNPSSSWGWTNLYYVGSAYLNYSTYVEGPAPCNPPYDNSSNSVYVYSNWILTDETGVAHPFSGASFYSQHGSCPQPPPGPAGFTSVAGDGSGYTLSVSGQSAVVYTKDGKTLILPENPGNGPHASTTTDRNGNQMTSGVNGVFTDTMGQTVLTWNGTTPGTATFSYTAPSGATAQFVAKYTTYSIQTNFGCSGITEYGTNGTSTASLVSEIDLPDGSKYSFGYEATPGHSGFITGRLASVTFPTGGTITYKYTGGNNGIICADGSTATLQRYTPDTGSNYSSYARAQVSGNHWQTTVTDPTGNWAVIDFQKDSGATPSSFETNRQTFSSAGILLQTVATCYNSSSSPCTGTTVTSPISQESVTITLPGAKNLQSKTTTAFNQYGLVTEVDEYDFGSGAPPSTPVRKTMTTYSSLGNNIVNAPSSIVVKDGSGSVRAQTTYGYDQTTPSAPTGTTPMHIAVFGSRGNLTTISYLTSGSSTISKTFTYYDTGLLKTSVDVNGTGSTTTYNYPDASSTCGNTFATSVNGPLSLSHSMTWNCNGGVQLTGVDENGRTTTTNYNDPYFWRPASIQDPAGATTNLCYGLVTSGTCNINSNQSESYLTFNSNNSTVDSLMTLDNLGRPHVGQTRQSPSSTTFDSSETDYDPLGRPNRSPIPYSASAGQTTSPTAPAVSTTYDALGRPLAVTDAGGGTVTYTYNQNDVLVAAGPIPTGSTENLKQRQLEYDGLGRLTSVCEITSGTTAWPGASCGQNTAASGYLTKYFYDTLGNLTSVTQNAQSSTNQQTRSFTFDAKSRLTSETNPESSTTTYAYDTVSSGTCAGTYNGDLVKRADAIGNITCFTYDSLHRLLSKIYTVTSTTVATPNKCFVYDAAIDGNTVTNTKTRLAEAYTTTSACSQTTLPANTTDVAFGYSPRGEITDVYEKTPHSGGTGAPYNHTTAQFWASGALNTLGGPVMPTLTYAVDAEGRTTTVSASSGPNPVTSTTYNPYFTPPQQKVTYGSGDSDTFNFDANTFRLTQYQFKVGSQTVTGAVNWNSDGSLRSLNIVDPFNSANTQNCSYTADDLARINKADCGTIWGQTFSYDAFGNVSKAKISGSGATSFNPTYQTSPSVTNRIASVGGTNATYDANGNSLNDTFRTFTWDGENRPVTIGSVSLTYDALGLMVEQSVAGANTEIVYSPLGGKLALMNGLSLIKAFAPLTGGATAVYTSGAGPAYYRHADHLGSSRLASTPSQTVYSDTAYSPFGEPYASSGAIDNSFTGQNQDTLSGLYDFPYREHDPNQGRWTQPDPAGLAAVDTTDPQSWNRYAYVRNRPLRNVDLLGLTCFALDEEGNPTDIIPDPGIDNAADCSDAGDFGGLWIEVDTTVTVNADNSGDLSSWGYWQSSDDWGTLNIGGFSWTAMEGTSRELTNLLKRLQTCPQASGMANSLKQLQDSGKLKVEDMGPYDGKTSLTGTVTIDSNTGITAHNLGHEFYHLVQKDMIFIVARAAAGNEGGSVLGVAGWAGARAYNAVAGALNGTPGFGPLDKTAEAFGQKISSQCGID